MLPSSLLDKPLPTHAGVLHGLKLRGKRGWLRVAQVLMVVLLATVSYMGWRHLYPALAETGWRYEVLLNDIEKVSAIALDAEGGLLLSEELQSGEGRILRYSADGSLEPVEAGLSKPDGMVSFRGGVVFSQEQGDEAVLWRTPQRTVELFAGSNVEGLANDGRYLYAIEDRHGDGRLLRYDPSNDTTVVLRTGLDQAEAITACPDGRLFYSEKSSGTVSQVHAEGHDSVVLTGLNQPGFLLCNNQGLWITEDATHMARLLRLAPDGRLHTVLSHLRSAQTLIETRPGHYLLAEQGRNRVLSLQRDPQETD
jgi:hypothetical protein